MSKISRNVVYDLIEFLNNDLLKDANGLDRFKCGFLVDNFQNGVAQSKLDPDFNASIDKY